MSKKILIVAGGTGGHIFPAISVAEALREKKCSILWVGVASKMEADLVPKYGFNIDFINMKSLRGKGFLNLLSMPFYLLRSLIQSLRIIISFKPDVVLGMGGFVCVPVGLAAFLARVPLIIHEQNKVSGLSNKLLSYFATDALSAFPDVFKQSNAVVVGNPLRSEILYKSKNIVPKGASHLQKKINILIFGGSLGAEIFNKNLPSVFKKISVNQEISLLHQCGKGNSAKVLSSYDNLNLKLKYKVVDFIDDMAEVYGWCDLVIARAGAITVSELSALKLPSILIPYALAVDDHQTYNALELSKLNSSIIISEKDFSIDNLSNILRNLFLNPSDLLLMGENASGIFVEDSVNLIADLCVSKGNDD